MTEPPIDARDSLLHAWAGLLSSLDIFRTRLLATPDLPVFLPVEHLPLWLPFDTGLAEGLSRQPPRRIALWFYERLEFLDRQDAKTTLTLPGLVHVDIGTIEAARAVNVAKLGFKSALLAFKEVDPRIHDRELNQAFEASLNLRTPELARALRRRGLARLCVKQVYRALPVAPEGTRKVRWTWASTSSIQRILPEQAVQLLLDKGSDPGIHRQVELALRLPEQEPLAIMQIPTSPHLRLNIVTSNRDGSTSRSQIKGPLPLLCSEPPGCVDFRFPPPDKIPNINRKLRNDLKLDPVPYLPAIRAHRYL